MYFRLRYLRSCNDSAPLCPGKASQGPIGSSINISQHPRSRVSRDNMIRSCLSVERREAILLPMLLAPMLCLPMPARASDSTRGFGRYIRKKMLDPLETYVPVCLIARCDGHYNYSVARVRASFCLNHIILMALPQPSVK